MRDEAGLAREIKAFRKKFKADHGRDPSRKDMNKYPSIAEIYDEWLAIKSANTASTSASSSVSAPIKTSSSNTVLKRKSAIVNSPRKRDSSSRFSIDDNDSASTSMGPPPTTPSKKKRVTYDDTTESARTFKTPTKVLRAGAAASPGSSVHDSGGSVIDVPSTPKQDSPGSPSAFASRWNHQRQKKAAIQQQQQRSPSKLREYESPRKIKELLSSFSSIHKTPTKEDRDEELMQRLTKGAMPAYTPRTKARKRLRGEVVITPEKARMGEERTMKEGVNKKRRGMAATTLKDFGIVSVAAPKGRVNGSQDRKQAQEGELMSRSALRKGFEEEEEGDEEDEVLGPSPSVNRIVDRTIKSFQPLFTGASNSRPLEDDAVVYMDEEQGPAALVDKDAHVAEAGRQDGNAKSIPVIERMADDEGEDADVVVVPYRPFGKKSMARQRRNPAADHALSDKDSEDEDDDAIGFYNVAAAYVSEAEENKETKEMVSSDEDASPILHALNLNSPQLKKARRRQRIKAERDIRHLLGTDDSLLHLAEEEEEVKAALPKSNKVGPPIKGGKLRKGFRDVSNSKIKEKESKVAPITASKKPRMILQNTREQLGSDQDSDIGGASEDDDEWASEVSSAEYGLGDGYMSDL